MDVDRVHFQRVCVLKTVLNWAAISYSPKLLSVSKNTVPGWLMWCWSGLASQGKHFLCRSSGTFLSSLNQLCHMWGSAMGCSSQPEHSCICHCTHLQLLCLPLKHLLTEFMEDTTKFSDWNRAGPALLFLNFNNVLAAVSKTFYFQSHFLCHTSTSVCPSGLRSLSAETAVLWHHVLSTFPSSASTSSLHSYLTTPLLSLLLQSSPSAPFICSSPAPPPCRCCHASLISACFIYPMSLPKLCESLAAFSESLWISLCLSPIWESLLPNCPTLLWHCTVPSMTKPACDSPQTSRGEEVSVKGSWDFPGLFLGENCREWRSYGDGEFNLIIYWEFCCNDSYL